VKLVSSTDYTVALLMKLKRDGLLQNQRVTRVGKLGRLLGSTLWVTHSVLQKFPDHGLRALPALFQNWRYVRAHIHIVMHMYNH